MWKRNAVAAVAALTVLVAGPAVQTAQAADCYTVPELPGECLDQATYGYIVNLRDERALLSSQVTSLRESLGLAQTGSAYWQGLSQQLAADLQVSRLETNTAKSDLESAYAEIDRRGERIACLQHRVIVQRATIKRLRDRLRDLP